MTIPDEQNVGLGKSVAELSALPPEGIAKFLTGKTIRTKFSDRFIYFDPNFRYEWDTKDSSRMSSSWYIDKSFGRYEVCHDANSYKHSNHRRFRQWPYRPDKRCRTLRSIAADAREVIVGDPLKLSFVSPQRIENSDDLSVNEIQRRIQQQN